MSTTGTDEEPSDDAGADTDADANRLFALYRRYIGEPDAETDVYVGFGLFFAGAALAAVGIVAFFLGNGASDEGTFWALRELAGVTGATGLPLLLLSVSVLLPVDRRAMFVGGAGLLVCLAAVGIFVQSYPTAWNVPAPRDQSALGVGVYAVGIVVVIASAGAALVGHQVERATESAPAARTREGGESEGEESAAGEEDEERTAAQAREDYEKAMSGADVNWGGVEKRAGKRLKLNTDAIDSADRSGFDNVEAKKTRSSGNVDAAVDNLKGLKGGEKKTASGGGTDDQAAALKELRQRQQEQREREEESESEGNVVDRLKGLFS